MIFVDPRQGSQQLGESLLKAGLPIEPADPQLPYGDLYFVGRGIKGAGLNIGIEHKTVPDLVNSLQTARLQGHQLQGMREAEPGQQPFYDHCWLVVEGRATYDRQGMLTRKQHNLGMSINELYKRLTVLHLCGGLNWVWFNTRRETVKWIEAFYQTWTDKDLDQHKSHLALYEAPTLMPISQCVRTLSTLPGVGRRIAKSAEQAFGSIKHAINYNAQTWANLEIIGDDGKPRAFGMSRANKVIEAITKETQ